MLTTRRWTLPAALCAALLAAAPPVSAQPTPATPDLHITAYGEYIAGRRTGMLDPAKTPDTTIPVDQVEDVHFLNSNTQIEARLCRGFGIQFEASNLATAQTVPITIRVTHPPMTYDGKTSPGVDSWQATITGKESGLAGYTFDHQWEAVPGDWSFAVLSGDKVLVEQHFAVVPAPGSQPALPCDPMTS